MWVNSNQVLAMVHLWLVAYCNLSMWKILYAFCFVFFYFRKSKRLHAVKLDFVGMVFQPIWGINSCGESVLESFLRLVSLLACGLPIRGFCFLFIWNFIEV